MNEMLQIAERYLNQTNQHVFLTGKAGTGKTTFLRKLVKETHKKVVVVAPTGIAAINAGGVTIHSFFQLPFGTFVPDSNIAQNANSIRIISRGDLTRNFKLGGIKQQLMKELELLVIDEVSMLRADVLDAIDYVLRFVRRKRSVPFGGVQVLFIGDLFQLPPVVRGAEQSVLSSYYDSAFFFDALVLKDHKPVYIELQEVYRQQQEEFISLLNRFRNNQVTDLDLQLLDSYYQAEFKPQEKEGYIILTTHNAKADRMNEQKLRELSGLAFRYKAKIEGEFPDNSLPHPDLIELKEGAQVIFIKNDSTGAGRYFNGKIGYVTSLSNGKITVDLNDGEDALVVEKYQWQNVKYNLNKDTGDVEEEIVGTFEQYPIKLAWAITVHKSQGLTFEKAILDLEGAFAAGQVYVALSRLTSLKGLVLTSKIKLRSLIQDQKVQHFSDEVVESPGELNRKAKLYTAYYFRDFVIGSFDLDLVLDGMKQFVESFTGKGKNKTKAEFQTLAMNWYKNVEKMRAATVKFQQQIDRIISEDESNLSYAVERVEAANAYFEPLIEEVIQLINEHISEQVLKKGMKGYLKSVKAELDQLKQLQLKLQKALLLGNALLKGEMLRKIDLPKASFESYLGDSTEASSKSKAIRSKSDQLGNGEKTDTKRLSLVLYNSGMSPKEIATKRELTVQTIENHLLNFVKEGEVQVSDFVSEEKKDMILLKAQQIGSKKLSDLKEALSAEFTYTEIRFALAH